MSLYTEQCTEALGIEDEDEHEDEDDLKRISKASTGVSLEPLYEFREHTHDAIQHVFAGLNLIPGSSALCYEGIEASRTFGGGAASIVEEFCSHETLAFAVAFGSIQQGGEAGSLKLVAYLSQASSLYLAHMLEQFSDPRNELKFQLIHLQFFMIKLHRTISAIPVGNFNHSSSAVVLRRVDVSSPSLTREANIEESRGQ